MKRILLSFSVIAALISCAPQRPVSLDVTAFYKPEQNPIVRADSSYTFFCPMKQQIVRWQRADVFNPAAIVRDNKVFLLYRCEDNPAAHLGGRTSRLGLAESEDGIHFKKLPTPVLFPDSSAFMQYDNPGGCEDPRLVETADGTYVVAYTAWNYKTPRLSIAFSKDLIHWEKKGPAFAKAHGSKFLDRASKSGSIITRMVKNKPVAAKINGKYWMYWGEHIINLAWSDNLYDWNPLLNDKGELLAVVSTRPGKFDSSLTECGPPAIITDKGIVLLYNGRNATDGRADPAIPKGTYSVGQVIFDPADPQKVISRSDNYFLKPTLSHEVSGQYLAVPPLPKAWSISKANGFCITALPIHLSGWP